jgi:hypothetical protein
MFLFSLNANAEIGYFTDTDNMTGILQYYEDGTEAADYNVNRLSPYASNANASVIRVGQAYSGTYDFTTDRTLFRFDTSAITTSKSITSATLKVVVTTNSTDTDFNIRLVAAQDTISTTYFGINSYNRFAGWENITSSFVVTAISNDVSTVGISAGDTLLFTLNAAGIARINRAGKTQFYMMSHLDIAGTAPTGLEYVVIEDDSPYMTITYYNNSQQITHFKNKDGIPFKLNNDGKTQTLWSK